MGGGERGATLPRDLSRNHLERGCQSEQGPFLDEKTDPQIGWSTVSVRKHGVLLFK